MVKWENCVNATLTTGGGGGGGNGIKTLDLSKLYIKKLSDDEYVEYADPTSYEYILVQRYLDDIKTKTKINIIKEDKTMPNYNTYGKVEAIKTQEEIELEEKVAKLKAEYDKKIAKLREEFKTAQEKKARDAKAKELHDKYQSLVDAGFSAEQAYDILQTKMKLDEL